MNKPAFRSSRLWLSITCLVYIIALAGAFNDHRNDPVLLIAGTRPEGIKMAPLYHQLKRAAIPVLFCSTGQHATLLTDVLKIFEIIPDFNLSVMTSNQTLCSLTMALLDKLQKTIEQTHPALVVVQGDTTSAMAGALAAFYLKIPVAHIEAGLRTNNIYMPFPEEINRRLISVVASLNFAPTKKAVSNLIVDGVKRENIYCTGNTVVDALLFIKEKLESGTLKASAQIKEIIATAKKNNQKLILLTAHRRESFDTGLQHIFHAIMQVLQRNKNLLIVYPVHPNPAISKVLKTVGLSRFNNIVITHPLNYVDMIYLMDKVDAIATDSGGIQEEGVTLEKRIIILRNETERTEGIEEGLAKLVGFDESKIEQQLNSVLDCKATKIPCFLNTYGTGQASVIITNIIKKYLGH